MKSQFSAYSNPAVPQWVSEVGLEWLFDLLTKTSMNWKFSAR